MSLVRSSRARGENRGGCSGGYEPTNPDYDRQKLLRLRREYDALDPRWRPTYLKGLSRFEREFVTNRRMEAPE
ncbi:MAG: hypothetical protein KGJ13_10290 [Patescibacteria group bacterium]|nr:hypothetical protein [Patescibacteria group bacterium]